MDNVLYTMTKNGFLSVLNFKFESFAVVEANDYIKMARKKQQTIFCSIAHKHKFKALKFSLYAATSRQSGKRLSSKRKYCGCDRPTVLFGPPVLVCPHFGIPPGGEKVILAPK